MMIVAQYKATIWTSMHEELRYQLIQKKYNLNTYVRENKFLKKKIKET